MTKLFSGIFSSSVGFGLVTFLIVAAVVGLQLIVNPRNDPVPFSIIPGGDIQIDYPGDPCRDIELNSFTPSIPIVASLTTGSSTIAVTKRESLEQVLFNHSLQVGLDPNQLTYYGVPVSTADDVKLHVRASSISPDIQSVTVLVYDVVDFSQFLEYATNATVYAYSLNKDCLYNVSGCTVNSKAQLEGWKYFVFETTPSPSTLVVTLEATVRKYDLASSLINDECTLFGKSLSCFLDVPIVVIYNDDDKDVDYFPFTITYETTPLVSNSAPSSQSLNVSVDLSWTCSRSDLYSYFIVLAVASVVLLIDIGFIVVLIFVGCVKSRVRKIRGESDHNQKGSTDVQLKTSRFSTPPAF